MRTRYLLLLALFLLPSGAAEVQVMLGRGPALFYLAAGVLLLWLIDRALIGWLQLAFSARAADLAAGLLLFGLLVAFLFVYPIADGRKPDGGSDRDDALNLATGELLAGRYPYAQTTYLDNPISPLPGALLLAAPFVLLGNSAYQAFFWLAIFYLLSRRLLGDSRPAWLLLLMMMTVALAPLRQLLVGGDLFINALYIVVLVVLNAQLWTTSSNSLLRFGVALLFGVALATRFNFILAAPPLAAFIGLRRGQLQGGLQLGVAGSTAAAVTLPFYLADPFGFSPLHTASEIELLDGALPYLGSVIVPMLMVLTTLLFCLPRFQGDLATLMLQLGLVQLLPVAAGALTITFYIGRLDFRFFEFGAIFLPFGALGAWIRLIQQQNKELNVCSADRSV